MSIPDLPHVHNVSPSLQSNRPTSPMLVEADKASAAAARAEDQNAHEARTFGQNAEAWVCGRVTRLQMRHD